MTKTNSLSQQRREEIFRAAHKCFVSNGFHATSMVDIAREFGMSVGHVYNYFPSKQAIIGGLIEQGIQEFYVQSSELLASSTQGDFSKVREVVKRNLAHSHEKNLIRLTLELLLEAARDPKLSQVIIEADRKVRAHLSGLHHIKSDEECARLEIMMAIFEGLGLRILRNPDINMEKVYDEVAYRLFMPRMELEHQIKELKAQNERLQKKLDQLSSK